MKRGKKEKLPKIPSGYELLDMVWRDQTPRAAEVLAGLPREVDKSWATTDGIRAFWYALLQEFGAREELRRTAVGSTLVPIRRRETERLRVHTKTCTKCIAAALRQGIETDWPKAAPEQIFLLIGQRFRALSYEAATEEEWL